MRRLLLPFLILALAEGHKHHHHNSKRSLNLEDPRNVYFLDDVASSNTSHYSRKLLSPGDPPKSAQEMLEVFSQVFLNFLSRKHRSDWDRLMQLTRDDAFIEACMASTYSMNRQQFEKWMLLLGNYYSKVDQMTSEMKLDESNSCTFELHYSTVTAKGVQGSDKWSFTASMDKTKGHFMIDTMYMVTDCRNIPKYPPLEPAVHEETFMANLRSKLVSDLFLHGSIKYKESFDGMYDFLDSSTQITVCDIGNITSKQLVDYWFKRYGKVTKYKDQMYNAVKKDDGSHHVDMAFTYEGEDANTFYRDTYQITVKKIMNTKISFFENFQDWSITNLHQSCTINLTPMSKHDEAYSKMALLSRRFDQLFTPEVRWNAVDAFEEMFDYAHGFNGYICDTLRYTTLAVLDTWIRKTRVEYYRPSPQETQVYDYEKDKVGFYIDWLMTAKRDNSTALWRTHFQGYATPQGWRFNHFAASCPF